MRNARRLLYRREPTLVLAFSCLIAFGTAHFVHAAWQSFEWLQRFSPRGPAGPVILHAPEAYRVAMPAVLGFVSRRLPWVDGSSIFAASDAILLCVTLPMVYLLSTSQAAIEPEPGPDRWLHIALALLFAVAALPWLAQYARPETMPSTFFLLASVICFRRRAPWCLPLQLGLTVVQAFTRADVPFCLGIATLLVGVFGQPGAGTERRRWITWGLTILFTAGLAQAYLQFIRFPHLTYDPGAPPVQLLFNLLPHRWINGLLAVSPVALAILCGLAQGHRVLVDTVDRICAFAALLYFALWDTVGALTEVRIYLPFLILLAPLAARSVVLLLHTSPAEQLQSDGH